MKRRITKSISLLLAIVIAFSVFSMTVFAEDEVADPTPVSEGISSILDIFTRIYNFINDIFDSIAKFLGRDSCTEPEPEPNKNVVEFSNGNKLPNGEEAFITGNNSTYGSVVENDDGTLTISSEGNTSNTGPYVRLSSLIEDAGVDGYTVEISVYIDPAVWAEGDGFGASTSINQNDENKTHLAERAFLFCKVNGEIRALVHTQVTQYVWETSEASGNTFGIIDEAGYYTLGAKYYNNEGILNSYSYIESEDGEIIDSKTDTQFYYQNANCDVPFSVVGAPRTIWFAKIDVTNGLKVRNITAFENK